MHLLNR